MKELISCEFNIDTGCVEAKFSDGSMIAVICTAVENEVADNMYEQSALDWLVYNAPVDYINLVLNGDVKEHLRKVTEYHPFENKIMALIYKSTSKRKQFSLACRFYQIFFFLMSTLSMSWNSATSHIRPIF